MIACLATINCVFGKEYSLICYWFELANDESAAKAC